MDMGPGRGGLSSLEEPQQALDRGGAWQRYLFWHILTLRQYEFQVSFLGL